MDIIELVNKTKNGDAGAFAQIYDQFADRIFRFIKMKVQNQPQAEDILQDTFIKAWGGIARLESKDLNFSAWLYRIAQNSVNDYYRKMYRMPEAVELNENIDIAATTSLPQELQRQNDIVEIKEALQYLPAAYRQVLELRFIQDFTISESAHILNKTNLATRLLQHRALKKLRETVSKKYDYGFRKI